MCTLNYHKINVTEYKNKKNSNYSNNYKRILAQQFWYLVFILIVE